MTNIDATSSLQPIAASNTEPSSIVLEESCPDLACAPTAASSNKSTTCAASDSAPSASPQTTHHIVTTVSSDESTKEVASASPDDHAVKGNVPPVVHQPSTKNKVKFVCAPSTSHDTTTTSNVGVATAVSSTDANKEKASAPKDNHNVKECLPPVVHQPSANNKDGIVCALGTSQNTTATTTKSNTRVATAVLSDDTAKTKASAPKGDHLVKGCLPPVVHHPSESISEDGVVSAPGTSHDKTATTTKSAAVLSDTAVTEKTSASKDNHLVKDCLPSVVHRPSAPNNEDGIVSAAGTSHAVARDIDITTATSSDQSTKVAARTNQPDRAATARGSNAHASNHLVIGEVRTTATEAPSRVLTAILPTIEVGGLITKRLHGVSIVAAPAEINAIENALAKKRKSEDEEEQLIAKKKKAKVPKDPNAPKKNMTPYMHYATYARAWIKARNPNVTATDATNTVREGWKEMSDEARRFWEGKSAADKTRYEKELAAYKNSELGKAWQARVAGESKQAASKSAISTSGKMKKAEDSTEAEDSTAPKPPKPAYMHYIGYALTQIGLEHPLMEDAEVANAVQSGWDYMIAEVRNYWDGIAAADKVRYQQELARFKAI